MSRLISTTLIDPSPWADLFPHDEEHVARLAEDIGEHGINTALQVYPSGNGRFELIAGHDRLEAAKRAGLRDVPVEMRSTWGDPDERRGFFIRDNTLRKDVNKRAVAKRVVRDHPDWSDRRVAEYTGVSHPTVAAARAELEEAGEVESLTTRTGRDDVAQPAGKPERPRTPEPAEPRAAKPAAPAAERKPATAAPEEDHGGSLADELAHADAEIRRLQEVNDALAADDSGREIVRLHEQLAQLRGRLDAEVTTKNEAVKEAKYLGKLVAEVRKELGVEKNSEILSALRARKAGA